MKLLPIFALVVLLPGCVFTPKQKRLVNAALILGEASVADPDFREIVRELAAEGSIDWSDGRHEKFPPEDQQAPDEYLLNQFATRGLPPMDSVNAWAKLLPPWSLTTAATYACGEMSLNVLRLRRSVPSVANTLVHERTHSFCQIHPVTQERPENVCDAAYVYGDLAEMLARYRETKAPVVPGESLCPALCRALLRRGITGRCPSPDKAVGTAPIGLRSGSRQ